MGRFSSAPFHFMPRFHSFHQTLRRLAGLTALLAVAPPAAPHTRISMTLAELQRIVASMAAAARAEGRSRGLNTPAELPRIGEVIAGLRGIPAEALAAATTANAQRVLPRLVALMP